MKAQRKLTTVLILIFVVFSIFFLAAKSLLAKWEIDNMLLLTGNAILFLISLSVFFIQRKALANSNPNVFIRSVIAGMMIKMFSCAIVVIIYVLLNGNNFSTAAIFIFLGLYIIYMVAEVGAILKLNKRTNA